MVENSGSKLAKSGSKLAKNRPELADYCGFYAEI